MTSFRLGSTTFFKSKKTESVRAHSLTFAVQQYNLSTLERLLNDIADPESKSYGKYLTKDEIIQLTKNEKSVQHILDFLTNTLAIITSATDNYEYITAEAPIAVWESIFNCEFHDYTASYSTNSENMEDSSRFLTVSRALSYSIPNDLINHVSAVFNIDQFPDPMEIESERRNYQQKRSRIYSAGTSNITTTEHNQNDENVEVLKSHQRYHNYITPALLNAYYNIQNNTGNLLGSQAVVEMSNNSFSPSDLTVFQRTFNLPVQPLANVYGGHVMDNACSNTATKKENCREPNLDVQYLMAVSQVTPTSYYYRDFSGNMWLDLFKEWADMKKPPLVITISWMSYERYYGENYLDTFNTEAMKLSLMGVTIVACSGDDGVSGYLATKKEDCAYDPVFPASSPYVTAVGGTMGPETRTKEIACQSNLRYGHISSGGGFSTVYFTPDWQRNETNSYFDAVNGSKIEPVPGYNRHGRGYPDISLVATSYRTIADGAELLTVGTSASAPVFAGMVSLINAERLAAGKPSLGWINPLLYKYKDKIIKNDIVDGSNHCIMYNNACCAEGFTSIPGWDPVTGLGSIDFCKFKSVFVALPETDNNAYLHCVDQLHTFKYDIDHSNNNSNDTGTIVLIVIWTIAGVLWFIIMFACCFVHYCADDSRSSIGSGIQMSALNTLNSAEFDDDMPHINNNNNIGNGNCYGIFSWLYYSVFGSGATLSISFKRNKSDDSVFEPADGDENDGCLTAGDIGGDIELTDCDEV